MAKDELKTIVVTDLMMPNLKRGAEVNVEVKASRIGVVFSSQVCLLCL